MERTPENIRPVAGTGASLPSASASAAAPSGMSTASAPGARESASPESVASRVAAARKAADVKVKSNFVPPDLPEVCREIARNNFV